MPIWRSAHPAARRWSRAARDVGQEAVVGQGHDVGDDHGEVLVAVGRGPGAVEEVGGHRVVAGVGEPAGHVLDVVVDPEGLLDDDDRAPGRAVGHRLVERHGAVGGVEVSVRVSIGPPRCPVGGRASSTLRVVDALFVAACGVVGAAVGGLLDPVGQQLADRSRAAEERDAAERAARRAARGAAGARTGAAASDRSGEAVATPMAVPELDVADPRTPTSADAPPVRHLLPGGPLDGPHGRCRRGHRRPVGGGGPPVRAPPVLVTPFLVFVAMAVAVSVTDLTHRLVPRTLIYGALALIVPLLVVVSAVDHTWHDLVRRGHRRRGRPSPSSSPSGSSSRRGWASATCAWPASSA